MEGEIAGVPEIGGGDVGDAGPGTRSRRRSSAASITKPPSKSKTRKQKNKTPNTKQLAAAIEAEGIVPSMRPLPLLICSVGNPGIQYANTLHSAGHTVLNRLAEHLNYPAFRKDRTHGNGLISSGGDWTLWQSTSYMNESGKGVRAAYMAWSKNISEGDGRLVIVHDELEKPLGGVSLRTAQGASAKGHNGLKSIMSVMGNTPFARIGIGVGRPVSRTSDDVARYVLKKMSPAERSAVEGSVELVVQKLKMLERG